MRLISPIAVFYENEEHVEAATRLADRFSVPVIDASPASGLRQKEFRAFLQEKLDAIDALFLQYGQDGLVASWLEGEKLLSIRADFIGPSVSYRRRRGGGRSETIAKAIGLKGNSNLDVIDATAGLGGDAFVLASLGCSVRMVERVPIAQALLVDALVRAKACAKSNNDGALLSVLERMHFEAADAVQYLEMLNPETLPEVIYLDPMFPEKKKSAAVKKGMQVFQQIVGSDTDADTLLRLALERAKCRVVVKRPRFAPQLGGVKPSYVLEGKRNRYDIHLALG